MLKQWATSNEIDRVKSHCTGSGNGHVADHHVSLYQNRNIKPIDYIINLINCVNIQIKIINKSQWLSHDYFFYEKKNSLIE